MYILIYYPSYYATVTYYAAVSYYAIATTGHLRKFNESRSLTTKLHSNIEITDGCQI
jgi:hypothetical protein